MMKRKINAFLFLPLLFFLTSCGVGRPVSARKNSDPASPRKEIVDYSKRYIGKPYRHASRGPNAFDCSGFTSFVFKEFGYPMSAGSKEQYSQFPAINRTEELQKGDLVFFEGFNRNGTVGHVGIVTDTYPGGTFRFIHASLAGVVVSSSEEDYYRSRYMRGGRVLPGDLTHRSSPTAKGNAYVKAKPKEAPLGTKNVPSAADKTTPQTDRMPSFLPRKKEVKNSGIPSLMQKEKSVRSQKETVILIQTDPDKIPPLKERRSPDTEEEPGEKSFFIPFAEAVMEKDSPEERDHNTK